MAERQVTGLGPGTSEVAMAPSLRQPAVSSHVMGVLVGRRS
jgi:hypothetical protein